MKKSQLRKIIKEEISQTLKKKKEDKPKGRWKKDPVKLQLQPKRWINKMKIQNQLKKVTGLRDV